MTTTEDTIIVFTARSPDRIVREGGSQGWVLNPTRARQCTWLVCTQNQHNADHEFSDATEPHGSAFLLGRVSGIRKSEEGDGSRWIVLISEYARIEVQDAWDHSRNPVRYASLSGLGINLSEIAFHPMPERPVSMPTVPPPGTPLSHAAGLTIAEAKRQLAATFGVKAESIEITIRG